MKMKKIVITALAVTTIVMSAAAVSAEAGRHHYVCQGVYGGVCTVENCPNGCNGVYEYGQYYGQYRRYNGQGRHCGRNAGYCHNR